jgi:hypothetical protein
MVYTKLTHALRFLTDAAARTIAARLNDVAALDASGADRILFWDQSAGKWAYLTAGTNLSISGTTLNAAGGGGAGGSADPAVADGRLTTESGVPVSTSDRAAQGTLYFTPLEGNQIGLSNGSSWDVISFAEVSLALSGLTSGKNYDIFGYNDGGALALDLGPAWTNDTTRATAIVKQDGIWVKSGDATRRYLGTFRASGQATTEDTAAKRYVWNAQKRVERPMFAGAAFGSYTVTGDSAFGYVNADSANRVEFVRGLNVDNISAVSSLATSITSSSGIGRIVGIGVNTASANSAIGGFNNGPTGVGVAASTCQYEGLPGLGFGFLAWIVKCDAGSQHTLYHEGTAGVSSGLIARGMF